MAGCPWRRVHFVGVGGTSMSGLAAALARLGVAVSGSDVAASPRTARLRSAGVEVGLGHDPARVLALPPEAVVVRSTDVREDNPELQAARARGLAVVHRSEVLAWFLAGGHLGGRPVRAVAVTGTHGKTTTTSLVALALLAGRLDPTVFVGADLPFLADGNFRLGEGPVVVAEADESDGTFLRYRRDVAVVTSLAPEHLEHYGGDFGRVIAAYDAFLAGVPADGLAVLCADDPRLARWRGATGPHTVWYGLGPGAELTARDLELGWVSSFQVVRDGRPLGRLRLGTPGRHNVQNALAALAVATWFGVSLEAVGPAFAGFAGAARRFEVLVDRGGVTVVDDYAHNPDKVAAALAAARLVAPRRVVAVFQPHRFARTRQLWDGFREAFRDADLVFLTDVYAPEGERPIPGVRAEALAEAVAEGSAVPVRYVPRRGALVEAVLAALEPGDVCLVMGAGDITEVAHELARRLQAPHAVRP
jgi:UDP-N-acetylmuramate--alanine ligase